MDRTYSIVGHVRGYDSLHYDGDRRAKHLVVVRRE
jgi:hypothetical protein